MQFFFQQRTCYLSINPLREESLETEKMQYTLPDGNVVEVSFDKILQQTLCQNSLFVWFSCKRLVIDIQIKKFIVKFQQILIILYFLFRLSVENLFDPCWTFLLLCYYIILNNKLQYIQEPIKLLGVKLEMQFVSDNIIWYEGSCKIQQNFLCEYTQKLMQQYNCC